MPETPVKKHSKLAVASTVLPLAVRLYVGLSFLLLSWKPSMRFVDWIFGDSIGALGAVIILAVILFGAIPLAGHLAGIFCGITGLFSKDKKRIFAVIGSILNITPFVAGLIVYKTGYDVWN